MGSVRFDFKDEVVVITGGSRGLGLEIAEGFGRAGAQVVITARREAWLTEAETFLREQGIAVHALLCDVASATSVEQTVQQVLERCGKIDILVNNAGLSWGTPAEKMPLERWQQVIDTNVTGTFLMSQVIGLHMLQQRKGVIINVASISGIGGGRLQAAGYHASKAAVINMTRALAIEWASHNIRLNCIAPGLFRTRMTEGLLVQGAEARESNATPLGRIGKAGEIAPTVLFLASEGASYITGQVIPIDGGRTAE